MFFSGMVFCPRERGDRYVFSQLPAAGISLHMPQCEEEGQAGSLGTGVEPRDTQR